MKHTSKKTTVRRGNPGEDPELQGPDDVKRHLFGGPDGAIGNRKKISILFADMKGSTALVDGLDPEDAADRLDPAVQRMIESVRTFDGTVHRIMGDGIMALFGAPIAQEDHALQACGAAIEMQRRVSDLNDSNIAIRVGIHTGEVVIRAIGNDLPMEFDASGPDVHLAARIEQIAEPGEIRISQAVQELVSDYLDAKLLGEIAVTGVQNPGPIYLLPTDQSIRSRWDARLRRGLSPFVGRLKEIARLEDKAEKTLAGRGACVSVSGPPGIGKSRLVHEFLSKPQRSVFKVLRATARREAQQTPFGLLSSLLRVFLEIPDHDPAEAIGQSLDCRLENLGLAKNETRTPLRVLLSLPPASTDWISLDPGEKRDCVCEAVHDVIEAAAVEMPLILVLEDLQWIDESSERAVLVLAELARYTSLLILATHRPDWEPDHHEFRRDRIELGPLSHDEAKVLFDQLIEGGP